MALFPTSTPPPGTGTAAKTGATTGGTATTPAGTGRNFGAPLGAPPAPGTRPGAPAPAPAPGARPGAPAPAPGARPGAAVLSTAPATAPAAGGVRPSVHSAGAPGPLGRSNKISNEEFIQLRDFIYQQSGIFIAEARKYLVENRLSNRLRELNLKNFGEYYYYLRFDPSGRAELPKLFEVITTNETSFWRNPPQLEVFRDVVLTAEIEKLRLQRSKKLRIWSAGCSTGEEPYTLAIILHEVLKSEIGLWDIKITANDLSPAVLAAAQKGIYNEYTMRTMPKELLDRYFTKDGERYFVDPKLKRLISFGPVNLSDRAMLKRIERSHIIFCRNVIIYFDDEMKRQVIDSFYDNLLPGGCMLIGHSESLHSISRAFKPEHHKGTIVYRKEE